MDTLKLVGTGHKVLLVRDDLVKFVNLGSIFSSAPKKEYLFSVHDITNVEVKNSSAFSSGNIQIQFSKIYPSLGNNILICFSGEENYKIALSMQQHIHNMISSKNISVVIPMPDHDRLLFDKLKELYPQNPYDNDDFNEVIAQIDSFISSAQDIDPIKFDDMLKQESLNSVLGSRHEVFGRASSLLDILKNLDKIKNDISFRLQSCDEYEEFLDSIPKYPFQLSDGKVFQRLSPTDIEDLKLASVGKSFNRDALISFVVVDLETTGLRAHKDDIVELSAIKFVEYEATEAFTTLLKPPHGIKEPASSVNNISQEMVENAPSIEQVMPAFIEFCGDCPLVGHNIIFDLKFLYANGFPVQQKRKYFDTLKISRKVIESVDDYKLDTLCEYYKIYRKSSHRALSDCLATGILFDTLIKSITE